MKKLTGVAAVVLLAGIAGAAETGWNADIFKSYKTQRAAQTGPQRERLDGLAKILAATPALPGGCAITGFENGLYDDPYIQSLGVEVTKGADTLYIGILDAVGVKTLPDGGKAYANSTANGQDTAWNFKMTVDKTGKITALKISERTFRLNEFPKPATILGEKTIDCR